MTGRLTQLEGDGKIEAGTKFKKQEIPVTLLSLPHRPGGTVPGSPGLLPWRVSG